MIEKNKFEKVRTDQSNYKWSICIKRENEIYKRDNDVRSDFLRDYNRILHCTAYRRLKHKTKVFFAPVNDHICTRIEHVNHVASISNTISDCLGLNIELTQAIATAHDLGHAPFGHSGEKFLNEIATEEIEDSFWHERNGLRFIDKIVTIEDPNGKQQNLNLTYAVRDGVISHCGEIDQNGIQTRDEEIELDKITKINQYSPFTWEACVVKMADKISYLGRDIQDAITLCLLGMKQFKELNEIAKKYKYKSIKDVNNTVLIHEFVTDLCTHSSPEKGISLSSKVYNAMCDLKKFNNEKIYKHEKLETYKKYIKLVIDSIYETLKSYYDGEYTILKLQKDQNRYPRLIRYFIEWIVRYAKFLTSKDDRSDYLNLKIYDMTNEKDYRQAIVDYISGMTDNFAISSFNEIFTF